MKGIFTKGEGLITTLLYPSPEFVMNLTSYKICYDHKLEHIYASMFKLCEYAQSHDLHMISVYEVAPRWRPWPGLVPAPPRLWVPGPGPGPHNMKMKPNRNGTIVIRRIHMSFV